MCSNWVVCVSVPLSGLSSFNGIHRICINKSIKVVSVPLSGLSSFNQYGLNIEYTIEFEFPSPYRGYHLSTKCIKRQRGVKGKEGFRPLIGVIIFQLRTSPNENGNVVEFPSPYRGYHLSTTAKWREDNDMGFRPLIGVIIFQLLLNGVRIMICVSVPLSGLSSFNMYKN